MDDEIRFYGSEKISLPGSISSLCNSFTYEFWIKADQPREVHLEAHEGIFGTEGQRYIVGPGYRIARNEASIGISAGVNGLSIYEHADYHMPAVLVQEFALSEWTHIAVVYDDRTPYLYRNGILLRIGVKSSRDLIYASDLIGGHHYGYYSGGMKDLRIWQGVRSEDQIRTFMNTKLNGSEPGLYYYDNAEQGCNVRDGDISHILMSIIIPSHDRFPLNSLNLHSLSHQTFPAEHMEVIFIDDASSDSTPAMLEQTHPAFTIKRIRTESNLGRSVVRNIGIRMSVGRRILFMDAEMLAHPRLVETHYEHHLQDQSRIVSASMRLNRIYTVLFPDYTQEQLLHVRGLYRDDVRVKRFLHYFIRGHRTAIQLIPSEQIQSPELLQKRSYLYDHYGDIIQTYGNELTGFHMPWINFITSNVSVSRHALFEAGLFDEQFNGYGWEDWELGYRLFMKGAKFVHDPAAAAYHQEHPISIANRAQSQANYFRFYNKHPHMEILLLTLTVISPHLSYLDLSNCLEEYHHIQLEPTNRYSQFVAAILQMLHHAADQYAQGHSLYSISFHEDQQLTHELEELRTTNQYTQLLSLYDILRSMTAVS